MDFDGLENLSEGKIMELYNNLLSDDSESNLAYCNCIDYPPVDGLFTTYASPGCYAQLRTRSNCEDMCAHFGLHLSHFSQYCTCYHSDMGQGVHNAVWSRCEAANSTNLRSIKGKHDPDEETEAIYSSVQTYLRP